MVPRSTPEDAVVRLHAAIGKTLQDPACGPSWRRRPRWPAAPMTLAESAKFFDAEDRPLPRHRPADQPAAAVTSA
jgi:hypothetical protein